MSYIDKNKLNKIVTCALKEDLGKFDITSESLIAVDKSCMAILLAKQECVVCGLEIARLVFKTKDKNIHFKSLVKDGDFVKKGACLAKISGKARSLLTAERVALNFLCLLSGVATKTREFVSAVKPYKTRIVDTRKTIPGLRILQKCAVKTGGGDNHRIRLDDMVLIKDNHLKFLGNKFWSDGYKIKSPKVKIEIEVKTLKEFTKALKLKPDVIMLDNMAPANMKKAVKMRNSNCSNRKYPVPELEASGNVTLKNVKRVASTGVDTISVGALTHSINSVDISLEII